MSNGIMRQFHLSVWLYDEKALEILGIAKEKATEILPGIFLNPNTTLSDLTKAIKLEERVGTFDFAVPESWSKENNYPKGLDAAVWVYRRRLDGSSSIFGSPYTVREMIHNLTDIILAEAMSDWMNKEVRL